MDRRTFVGAAVVICGLVGPVPAEVQVAPEFVAHIIIAKGDAFNGWFVEIFAGDVMQRTTITDNLSVFTDPVPLYDGAFERLREAAEEIIGTTPGANPRDIPCQDYGRDAIAVVSGPETIDLVSANCPDSAVLVATNALMDLLQAEILE